MGRKLSEELRKQIKCEVHKGMNIKSFISKIRRVLNIHTEFEAARDTLIVRIRKKPESPRNIDFSNKAFRIIEETYSSSSIGRITAICEENGRVTNWYLLTDGTITQAYQADNQVMGDWVTIQVDKAEDVQYTVRDEFAKNTYSHKILFDVPRTRARFDFYDKLIIATEGRLFRSYIAAIRTKKNSNRIEYQCGELRATLLDGFQEDL